MVRILLAVLLLVLGWTFGWFVAWQSHLLQSLYVQEGSGLTVFIDEGDHRVVWVGTAVGLLFGAMGLFSLAHSAIFRADPELRADPESARWWSLVWRVAAALCLTVGLAAPILFPSAKSLVIDERRSVVSLERQWLYTATAEELPFDDLALVNLRVQRRLVRGVAEGCKVATGLSLVRHSGGWIEISSGFDHELVASRVVEITGASLREKGVREC